MSLLQDIRYGARMLASKPGVTAAAVLSLALGVGANSAVFSLIDALALRGLPGVEAPQELVIVGPGRGRGVSVSTEPLINLFSYPRFSKLRDGAKTLSSVAAIGSSDPAVYIRRGGEESPLEARARLVSGEYFSMLGVRPARGRLIGTEDESAPGAHPVAVLDYGFWQETFGGADSAVGTAITLNDKPFTIVGVAPQGFAGERLGDRPKLYLPLLMQAEAMRNDSFLADPNISFLQVLGRLAPATSQEQAQAQLAPLWQSILLDEVRGAPSEDWKRGMDRSALTLRPGANGFTGFGDVEALWLLFGVTALVLLIACANVANLLLARGATRAKEMGVRLALGANRGRLFGQLLTESLLLAALSGGAAVLIADWSRRALVAMTGMSEAQIGIAPGFDWRVLAFTAAAALLTGLLFGAAPAWRAGRTDLMQSMRGGRGALGGPGGKLRTGLVVGQAALSLLLLFIAGLFLRSLSDLANADLGFQRESLLSVRIDPRGGGLEEAKQPEMGRRLLDAVQAIPGVRSAALSSQAIIQHGNRSNSVTVRGYESAPEEDMDARMFFVSPGFFETIGATLLTGRSFGPADEEGSKVVLIADKAFADRFFQGGDPLAQNVQFDGDLGFSPVVGLTAPIKLNSAREEGRPTLYVSGFAHPGYWGAVNIRTVGDPDAVAAAVRHTIEKVEPNLPVNEITSVEQRLATQARPDRMLLQLISGFGLLALALAAVGLYGVLSFRVAGRTSEIGLRMAVGADRGDVLGLVLKEGLLLAGAGVALGAIAAPFAAQAVQALLFQPETWNATPLLVAAGAMLAVAALATLAPSLRAARLDPVTALREE
ncbi:MAG: ABC transporter permease [Acidobacteria bacterium]|nr:ABC transporter permease [Acidobacteriota bacterium]